MAGDERERAKRGPTVDNVEAAELRSALVDRLVRSGTITTTPVQRALRLVPRHFFLPGIDLQTAYADEAVALKWAHGTALSSVSQPTMVASMLEMLDVHRGGRVLEIGTGSGYNAALLAELVGGDGIVVSVEIDGQLAEIAESQLESAGYRAVRVHTADGRAGWPEDAPYDRIIVTASAPRPEPSWVEQLRDRGRLVVPLAREREAVIFDKAGDVLLRDGSCPALFIPMR